jgi:hypothetical protein
MTNRFGASTATTELGFELRHDRGSDEVRHRADHVEIEVEAAPALLVRRGRSELEHDDAALAVRLDADRPRELAPTRFRERREGRRRDVRERDLHVPEAADGADDHLAAGNFVHNHETLAALRDLVHAEAPIGLGCPSEKPGRHRAEVEDETHPRDAGSVEVTRCLPRRIGGSSHEDAVELEVTRKRKMSLDGPHADSTSISRAVQRHRACTKRRA